MIKTIICAIITILVLIVCCFLIFYSFETKEPVLFLYYHMELADNLWILLGLENKKDIEDKLKKLQSNS